MVPSANVIGDIMDYLISHKWINQGSKQKMNTIQRVSVNTDKTMNFTIYNNKKPWMLKLRIQVGGTTPGYNPTILKNISTLSNITLIGIIPYLHWCPVPKISADFSFIKGFPLVLRLIASYVGASDIGHDIW